MFLTPEEIQSSISFFCFFFGKRALVSHLTFTITDITHGLYGLEIALT